MASLTYPDSNSENYNNILLIDRSVKEASLFYTSVNASTFPIIYSRNSTKNDLLTLLQAKFTSIQRIAFVFHGSIIVNTFLDNEPFFKENELTSSENVNFLITLFNQFKVQNVDYLACNTLNYPNWSKYYQLLTTTGVIVGASNDETGNIKYGGDWVMENTSENIELIYFTKSIEYYKYVLGSSFKYSSYIIANNILYGAGSSFNNRIFNAISIPDNKTIQSFTASSDGLFIITTDNLLYGRSFNLTGELGLGNNNNYYNAFQLITIPDNKIVKSVSCGFGYTFVLTTTGLMYCTGYNRYGQLGLGTSDNSYNTFQLVTIPNKIIRLIECGDYHTVVLTTDNLLYGTGYNSTGQLGLSRVNTLYDTFQQITFPYNKVIRSISCGSKTTFVLTIDNLLYGTGKASLGLGDYITRQAFELITIPDKTIQSVKAGDDFAVVLTTDNLFYGTGFPTNYGAGDSYNYIPNTFILVTIPNKTIQSIECGEAHTLVLTTDNLLYGAGYNYYGQLGLGPNAADDYYFFQLLFGGASVSYIMQNMPIYDTVNICFPVGSLILTDQGEVEIEKINTTLHTINQKKIVDITKTLSDDKELVFFQKDSIGPGVPSRETRITMRHCVSYNDEMWEAHNYVDKFIKVHFVSYKKEILYNVLLEEDSTILVNNMICETLSPKNIYAKLYTKQCKYPSDVRNLIIYQLDEFKRNKDYTGYNKFIKTIE